MCVLGWGKGGDSDSGGREGDVGVLDRFDDPQLMANNHPKTEPNCHSANVPLIRLNFGRCIDGPAGDTRRGSNKDVALATLRNPQPTGDLRHTRPSSVAATRSRDHHHPTQVLAWLYPRPIVSLSVVWSSNVKHRPKVKVPVGSSIPSHRRHAVQAP